MIPKKYRINKVLFKKVIDKPIFLNSEYLSLRINQNPEGLFSRFLFSCSKKTSNSAVKRNLLRRRGYSVIRKLLLDIKGGYMFCFSFKKDADKQSHNIIESNIKHLLKNYIK
jgi:ribonuclease P protein component